MMFRADAHKMVRRHSTRPILGWILVLVSVMLAGLGVALFGMAQDETAGAEHPDLTAESDRLLDARRSLELATAEVVAIRMLDGVGVEGDRSDRLDEAAARVESATATIRDLAEGEGPVAEEAEAILDDADPEALSDPREADVAGVFDVASDYARYSGTVDVVRTKRDAIQQLSFVSALPLHAFIEGIAADTSVNGRDVDPTIVDFVDDMVEVVRTEGGWFGIDPTAPLVGSVWIEIDEGREMLPAAAERLSALVASSDLVRYDVWMRELGDGDDAPPFTLADMFVAVDLQTDLVAVIEQLVEQDRSLRLEAAADAQSQRRALLTLAGVVAGLSLTVAVVGLRQVSRASRVSRDRARLATTDALTSVGNRHELDERTRPLTLDPRFSRHLVAIMDLDDFKMVNDLYGHHAGDAVLVEVAARLSQLATRAERDEPGTVASVIRLGGDEFLLTVHGLEGWDDSDVRATLEAIRHDTIDYRGEQLPLSYSLGVVVADGPNELSDLMRTADIAAYDDKAGRARSRRTAGRSVDGLASSDPRPA